MQVDQLGAKAYRVEVAFSKPGRTYQQPGLWETQACLETETRALETAAKGLAHHLSRYS